MEDGVLLFWCSEERVGTVGDCGEGGLELRVGMCCVCGGWLFSEAREDAIFHDWRDLTY